MGRPRKLSQSKFADEAGITRQNVHQLVKAGTLELDNQGRLDLANKKNREYLDNKEAHLEKSDAHKQYRDPEYVEAKGTLETLKRDKLKEQVEKLRIENEARRNLLIDRDLVARVFAKIQAVDGELINMGQNLSPEIRAICGVNDEAKEIEIQALIEKEVWRSLRSSKRMMDEFLNSLKVKEDE